MMTGGNVFQVLGNGDTGICPGDFTRERRYVHFILSLIIMIFNFTYGN